MALAVTMFTGKRPKIWGNVFAYNFLSSKIVFFREYCGLPKALSFFSLKGVMRDETIERLQAVYESAEDIDLYTGVVSELPLEG